MTCSVIVDREQEDVTIGSVQGCRILGDVDIGILDACRPIEHTGHLPAGVTGPVAGYPLNGTDQFMVENPAEDAPTGRPAGAIGWAGLANTFYWIDRKNGFGGYWATQILPFGDPISFGGYLDFETAAYATGEARAAA